MAQTCGMELQTARGEGFASGSLVSRVRQKLNARV
jgi:hypothetical protein